MLVRFTRSSTSLSLSVGVEIRSSSDKTVWFVQWCLFLVPLATCTSSPAYNYSPLSFFFLTTIYYRSTTFLPFIPKVSYTSYLLLIILNSSLSRYQLPFNPPTVDRRTYIHTHPPSATRVYIQNLPPPHKQKKTYTSSQHATPQLPPRRSHHPRPHSLRLSSPPCRQPSPNLARLQLHHRLLPGRLYLHFQHLRRRHRQHPRV